MMKGNARRDALGIFSSLRSLSQAGAFVISSQKYRVNRRIQGFFDFAALRSE
jgi:hypothetical protein